MLDFPPSPAVGATLTGPSGRVWKWDGLRWLSVLGGGEPQQGDVRFDSGTLEYFDGSAWQQIPWMGVTDGSNAAPGEIGEFWTETIDVINLIPPGGGAVQLASITSIPAGDWDVYASSEMRVTAFPGNNAQIAVYQKLDSPARPFGAIQNNTIYIQPAGNSVIFPPDVWGRLNSIVPAQITIDLEIRVLDGAMMAMTGVRFFARRMR